MFTKFFQQKFGRDGIPNRYEYSLPKVKLVKMFDRTTPNITELLLSREFIYLLFEDGQIKIVNRDNFKSYTITKYCSSTTKCKSIFYNKIQNSLYIVYVSKETRTPILKCIMVNEDEIKTLMKEYFKKEFDLSNLSNINNFGVPILENECLSSPGFIEFDDINQILLTRNSLLTFKVWRLEDLKLIFEINDRRINEIRTTENILMTIRAMSEKRLELKVYEIKTGKYLLTYALNLIDEVNSDLEILELFETYILVKQRNKPAIILDLIFLKQYKLENCNFDSSSMFLFICKYRVISILCDNYLYFYNYEGKLLMKIKNNDELNANFLNISPEKKFLFVYNKNTQNIKKSTGRFFESNSVNRRNRIDNFENNDNFDDFFSYNSDFDGSDQDVSEKFLCSVSSIKKKEEFDFDSPKKSLKDHLVNGVFSIYEMFDSGIKMAHSIQTEKIKNFQIDLIFEQFYNENENLVYFTIDEITSTIYFYTDNFALYELTW